MSGGGGGSPNNTEWRFNQTLRNVQGMLKGRSFPGKVLLTRRSEPLSPPDYSPSFESEHDEDERKEGSRQEGEGQASGNSFDNASSKKSNILSTSSSNSLPDAQGLVSGARATDSARIAKFTTELSRPAVILDTRKTGDFSVSSAITNCVNYLGVVCLHICDLMYGGFFCWLQGYAPPNKDRREGVLTRKRLEYVECVSQYYDIPDSERSDEEITMLRQIAVDCPRTVPDVTFFQNHQIQKSLERILYTWAIRHPASGYVQGINDLVTPFLVVFLSEHLDGNMDTWSVDNLSAQAISNIEADCYWCLSKFLDGMQDHYTFAQPGIQRLVFRLKELVRRIDGNVPLIPSVYTYGKNTSSFTSYFLLLYAEPVSKHIEEQGLEFLQFAFRWFNCLLIREVPFHLVTRLWDTYLAEGDYLPDFLVYISASFLLTWSDKLQKLDFQEMVMFLQHLPTRTWAHHELEMVLSRAYMWHTMFKSSPSHLAG
ncbi:TBC1 domain family member 22A [Zea mays]|uniref:TBC1 domain family member 22A n=1 Tax=Zea mays TaxID=4577 RepID=A0A1D6QAU4_MAIZE|nr:TBC1 domain family member 22A [Zea mays]